MRIQIDNSILASQASPQPQVVQTATGSHATNHINQTSIDEPNAEATEVLPNLFTSCVLTHLSRLSYQNLRIREIKKMVLKAIQVHFYVCMCVMHVQVTRFSTLTKTTK